MPTICMFYGIIVSIFFEENERHHLPHIDARYQGMKASVSIDDGAVLAGSIPPKQLKMLQVWVDLYKDELLANWELAIAGEEPFRIEPLR
ncbi:MAG: DUF4160 domain-containing protein [Desulfobacteraceae bacterium]|nr:DUF4160 domain-containing protein [Desulfobacteraceae bacterium]